MVMVRVPASSANMGAGFDTLGVAVGLYNRISVEEIPHGLIVECDNMSDYIPRDEKNLIYRSAMRVFEKAGYTPSGLRIIQKSDIPVTRGLGSSSACIIGGSLAANVISGRKLSYSEILNLALETEGHPDNLAPALYGGFCVSMTDNDKAITKSIKLNPKIKFAAMIPSFFVPTKKSRKALPEYVSHKDAAFNVSRAAMFTAILSSGRLDGLRAAAEDRLHQPYREAYVGNMKEIFDISYELGAKATYLSGSGPTIMSVLDGNYSQFRAGMREYFKKNNIRCDCKILSVDNVGAVVKVTE